MNNDIKDREEKIYNIIMKMEDGTNEEKSFAFECMGILGNENQDIKLEDKLDIVEKKITIYENKIKKKSV